jgi:hypothetical protein
MDERERERVREFDAAYQYPAVVVLLASPGCPL